MLLDAMRNPRFYDHAVDQVEMIETHISWVFLAGDYAYKVKKPLDLGFLDFSTLGRRRHFCREEIRLNRRFAPELYLDTVPIGDVDGHPALNAEPAIEYAVKMKRFPDEARLDRMLADGALTERHLAAFGEKIAALHREAPVCPNDMDNDPDRSVSAPARQNFDQLTPLIDSREASDTLVRIAAWTDVAYKRHSPVMRQRLCEGRVRECHGDIHLANMVWLDERPVLFDCIEFSEQLRRIDVMNDIAFLLMDLDDRGKAPLGLVFLNRYLLESGDYLGVELLSFYKAYRAMVRAKVGFLQLDQERACGRTDPALARLATSYIDLAARYIDPDPARLFITHGPAGSGKTTFVERLAPHCNAVIVHSDAERKRLHGLGLRESSDSKFARDLYCPEATIRTYRHLNDLAELLLRSGSSVIVDATFLDRERRREMSETARKIGAPFRILDFQVDRDELEKRLRARESRQGQLSEADRGVLAEQLEHADPLDEAEGAQAVRISATTDVRAVLSRLSALPG